MLCELFIHSHLLELYTRGGEVQVPLSLGRRSEDGEVEHSYRAHNHLSKLSYTQHQTMAAVNIL